MLLPALGRSKAEAQMTVCKNHLHQMGLALEMYADDTHVYPYDGYFVGEPQTKWIGWEMSLTPYYQLAWTNQEYHCPTYNGVISWSTGGNTVGLLGSYSYNLWGAAFAEGSGHSITATLSYYGLGADDGADAGRTVGRARTVAQIVAPSQLYALMDTKETLSPLLRLTGA